MADRDYKALAERAIRMSHHHDEPVKCPSCGREMRHADKDRWCIFCQEDLEEVQRG